MLAFQKHDQVVSKRSGKRGFVDKIEFDESHHCLMFRVDMGSEKFNLEGKIYDGCYFWYKANDICSPSDYNKDHVAA